MATIYRKSAKGTAEIETRAHRLAPRLRSLLILVDGRKSDEDLARLVPQAADALAALLTDGFIEPAPVAQPPARPSSRPATQPQPQPQSTPQPQSQAAGAPGAQTGDLQAMQRLAVRQLTDLVGPLGEALAMRIERARTLDELRPLLETAQQVIANTRGRQAAADFLERLRGP